MTARSRIAAGVGPGMGRSIAMGFAGHGVDVVIAARDVGRLEAVADEYPGSRA